MARPSKENTAAKGLMKLMNQRNMNNMANYIISARILNRNKYIETSPYLTRAAKNFLLKKVKTDNATLDQIKKFENVMKNHTMKVTSSFLESLFTPRKNVKK